MVEAAEEVAVERVPCEPFVGRAVEFRGGRSVRWNHRPLVGRETPPLVVFVFIQNFRVAHSSFGMVPSVHPSIRPSESRVWVGAQSAF